jgi:hypothetical protein
MANDMGWFGWFSLAGFVILGILYLLEVTALADTEFLSPTWTLIIAIIAGIGAALLYFGNDPTASDEDEYTETT